MRPVTPDQVAVLAGVLSLFIMSILAVVLSLVAIFARSRRKGILTLALCLWCSVAGFTLSSAIWSWMAMENLRYEQRQIQQMPPDTLARDAKPHIMAMILFFVKFDRLGQRFLYATVLIPLILCFMAWKRTEPPAGRRSEAEEIDALFRG